MCHAKYKTTNGVLIEWIINGKAHICRADFPPAYIENVRDGLSLLRNRNAVSPAALLDAIPASWPRSTSLVPLTGPGEGWYKYDPDELAHVPCCNWASFFEMGRASYTGEWVSNQE